jgi:protoporphyrinogen oxidase
VRDTGVDLVVLGAGPAGLGAALAAARAGARVAVVEGADRVGGLCVTRRVGDLRWDLGGHIPFVNDVARLEWLRGLLGDDLAWVPRPVGSWRDGRVRPGRYLDQRPGGAPLGGPVTVRPDPPPAGDSAAQVLTRMFGRPFVDAELRRYLEKVDGVPLEAIPGTRPLALMRNQAAPDGFWFPALGIGQLMEAMADAVTRAGGTVHLGTRATAIRTEAGAFAGLDAEGPAGPVRLGAPRLVVATAAGMAARLLRPAGPEPPPVRMRAVALVALEVPGGPVTDQAWVQVDDPRVPAGRIFEMGNWSPAMTPGGRAVIGLECYCRATPDDPVWGLDDDALAARCAAALADPLGWVADPAAVRPLEVVRLPRAYPSPELAQMAAVGAGAAALRTVRGVHLAPGAAVIEAVDCGEAAARAALGG